MNEPDTFLPLREWMRASASPAADEIRPEPLGDAPAIEEICIEDVDECAAIVAESRRFRASLADMLAACASELLADIAAEVVARELTIAPCDVGAIIDRAIERYCIEPVRVRVNSEDARKLDGHIPIVCDERLRTGDVVLETNAGSIDATLGTRLDRVLAGIRG